MEYYTKYEGNKSPVAKECNWIVIKKCQVKANEEEERKGRGKFGLRKQIRNAKREILFVLFVWPRARTQLMEKKNTSSPSLDELVTWIELDCGQDTSFCESFYLLSFLQK